MKQPVYAPGTVIAGKYRIDQAIARGGCSIVYRGTHIDMQRSVALKIMTPDAAGDDEAWTQRFQREAKLASQLRHPNTITTYDHGHDSGLWYIIMEWVEGASLRNVVRDSGPIEPERTAHLTVQMLKSLEEAHRAKILHRDMKPSNIMLTHDVDGEEQVKVLDFGLAKADPSQMGGDLLKLTRDGDFVGTPRYASPEQLKGRPLTNASDIYGVGMVMWEMLTGQPAVPQVDYAVCVEHHLGPRPWTLPPGQHPPGLAMIVEKALKKNPDERYTSCREMRKALKGWLDMTVGHASFDLFEELDNLESEFEQDMLADALSDAVSVVSESYDDDDVLELAPTKKNPTSRLNALELDHAVPVTGLGGESSAGDDDSSPAARASFSNVPGSQLELDPHAAARTKAARPRVSASEASEPEQDASRLIGVLVLLIAAAIILGVSWVTYRANQNAVLPQVEADAGGLQGSMMLTDMRALDLNTSQVLTRLKEHGWKLEREPASAQLGNLTQTTARVKMGLMEADLILYECDSSATAKDLAAQAKAPTQSYMRDRLVVWLTPVGDLGEDSVSSLIKVLEKN
jgi:serine/threonine protein kinase